MTLLYPAFLWLLLPLAILWYYRPGRLIDTGHIAVMVLILFALSRPALEGETEKGEIESRNIIIGLDASYSMRAKDIAPDRYRYAVETIDRLLTSNHTDNMMLIAFTSNPLLLSPPTTDHLLISMAMKSLNRDNILTRGTSLKKLFEKLAALPMREKILILLTDGGDKIGVSKLSEILRRYRTSLIVMALGTPSGSTIEKRDGTMLKDKEGNLIVSRINPDLERLAQESGGRYITPPSDPQAAAEKIETAIEEMTVERQTVSKMQHRYRELYQIPLLIALLLFLILHTRAARLLVPLAALWGSQADASMLDGFRLHQAYDQYERGDLNASMQILKRITTPSLEQQIAKAGIYYKEQQYKKALALYRSIRSTSPHIKQLLYYNIGNCYARMKDYDEAIRHYSKALQLGRDEDADHNLALIVLKRSREKDRYRFSRPKPQGSGGDKNKNNKEDKGKEKQDEQNSGGNSGGGVTGDSKKRKKEEKILLRPSKKKEEEQPLSSKVYDLINKGYVHEKSPW